MCLPRALAAHAMLRRRGIASSLCLGVARSGGAFAAHARIEVGEEDYLAATKPPALRGSPHSAVQGELTGSLGHERNCRIATLRSSSGK